MRNFTKVSGYIACLREKKNKQSFKNQKGLSSNYPPTYFSWCRYSFDSTVLTNPPFTLVHIWPTVSFISGFPGGSAGKETVYNVGDLDLTPGLGRSPGEGKGYPLQYSGLENSIDCIVHGVTKSQTQLSDFHFAHLYHLPISCRDLSLYY